METESDIAPKKSKFLYINLPWVPTFSIHLKFCFFASRSRSLAAKLCVFVSVVCETRSAFDLEMKINNFDIYLISEYTSEGAA